MLRERFPNFADSIRRSLQSDMAYTSDVTGIPGLWLECNHSKNPNPINKLNQAITDSKKVNSFTIPVAIWHKTRSKSHNVTMRTGDYVRLATCTKNAPLVTHTSEIPVTILLEDFFLLLETAQPWSWDLSKT